MVAIVRGLPATAGVVWELLSKAFDVAHSDAHFGCEVGGGRVGRLVVLVF